MGNNILITIIVPVYNAEQYLERCINSIVGQTLKDIEIVCVNDGSTDKSLQVLKRFKDDRLIIIDKENEGVAEARNCGLDVAKGRYIMFVDSDDWLELNACELAYDSMVKEQADIVMWSYITETEERSTQKDLFPHSEVFSGNELKNKIHRRFIGVIDEELAHPELADALCPVWGKLYSRDVILKSATRFVDLKEIGTYEDGLFNLDVFGSANRAVLLPEHLYHYYRASSQSVTSGYRKKLAQQWDNLFDRMQMYITQNEMPEDYQIALSNRIALSILGLGLNVMQANKSHYAKIKEIKSLLSRSRYKEASKKMNYQFFPLHWRVFFKSAKHNFAVMVYFMLLVINRIIQ